jgi:hypothetical protein
LGGDFGAEFGEEAVEVERFAAAEDGIVLGAEQEFRDLRD